MWSKLLSIGMLAVLVNMVAPTDVYAQLAPGPTASVSLGQANPPAAGSISATGTWAGCTGADSVKLTVQKVTATKPRQTMFVTSQTFVRNINASGSQQTSFGNLTSGDTIVVTIEVFNAQGRLIASGSSLDSVVP
jgi:hypothetical protein